MKSLLFLLFVIPFCTCSKKKDLWKIEKAYIFQNNKQIDTARNVFSRLYVQVNPGSKIVFNYNHKKTALASIADGDLDENLYFEIPAGAISFNYTNTALMNASCFYSTVCFCEDLNARLVTTGTIQGIKKSDTVWAVNADFLIPNTTRKFTLQKDFILQN